MKLTIRLTLATALAALLAASNAGPAIAGPSFDCKAAKTAVEKFICRNKTLSALDRQIADAYTQALGRLADDPAAVADLLADQKIFVWQRDLDDCGAVMDCAVFSLRNRRNFLVDIAGRKREGFAGNWAAADGIVTIEKGKNGKLSVSVGTIRGPTSHSCDWHDDDAQMKGAKLVSGGSEIGRLELTRSGRRLIVETIPPNEGWYSGPDNPHRSCGARGSLDGTFFPVDGRKTYELLQ